MYHALDKNDTLYWQSTSQSWWTKFNQGSNRCQFFSLWIDLTRSNYCPMYS